MSWKDDAPQFDEQQISRLQRGLRRNPQHRKMRDYDTLGAVFSFAFGVALGVAIISPFISFDGQSPRDGLDIVLRAFSGLLVGLLMGFLPAGFFLLGFKSSIHLNKREPKSSRPPMLLGALGPPIALGIMYALEAFDIDPSWSILSMFVWAFLSGWIWVQRSPKKGEVPI